MPFCEFCQGTRKFGESRFKIKAIIIFPPLSNLMFRLAVWKAASSPRRQVMVFMSAKKTPTLSLFPVSRVIAADQVSLFPTARAGHLPNAKPKETYSPEFRSGITKPIQLWKNADSMKIKGLEFLFVMERAEHLPSAKPEKTLSPEFRFRTSAQTQP